MSRSKSKNRRKNSRRAKGKVAGAGGRVAREE